MTTRIDYTPGAGGALTGVESALSSLPSCPCAMRDRAGIATRDTCNRRPCGKPSRPVSGRDMECDAGHVFVSTREEREQARGALAAAKRRAARARAGRPS